MAIADTTKTNTITRFMVQKFRLIFDSNDLLCNSVLKALNNNINRELYNDTFDGKSQPLLLSDDFAGELTADGFSLPEQVNPEMKGFSSVYAFQTAYRTKFKGESAHRIVVVSALVLPIDSFNLLYVLPEEADAEVARDNLVDWSKTKVSDLRTDLRAGDLYYYNKFYGLDEVNGYALPKWPHFQQIVSDIRQGKRASYSFPLIASKYSLKVMFEWRGTALGLIYEYPYTLISGPTRGNKNREFEGRALVYEPLSNGRADLCYLSTYVSGNDI